MAYTKYSLTPANNNAAPPDGAPEGMLPSAVNDTMRDMMAQIRDVGDGVRNGTYTMTAPVITGGSITGVALSGNTLTNPVITGGSINNTTVGATTRSTGAFTTLASNGATTFTAGTASTSTTTGTAVITGGLGVSGRINAANFDGIVGANTAAAGNFTTLGATGVATFSAGTVSAPAITTTGDTNTGIYFPAADTIGFTEGGVEGLRLNANGQTSTSIAGTASLPSFTRTGDENTGIFFPAADTIAFTEGGVESMRITSDGDLGIGTASPLYRIDATRGNIAGVQPVGRFSVSGNGGAGRGASIIIGSGGSGSSSVDVAQIVGYQLTASATANNAALAFQVADSSGVLTERMYINNAGNVGIGTSSPIQRLDVVSTSTSVSQVIRSTSSGATNVSLRLQDGTTGTSNIDGIYLGRAGAENFLWTYENEPWVFATNNTERMRIDSSGNVGIGTSSPAAKLNVVGGGTSALIVAGGSGSTIRNVASAGSSWYVGTNVDSYILHNESNTPMLFTTNGTERMRIDSSGNLLIGRTSAIGKLTVQGSAASTQLIYALGDTSGDLANDAVRISKFDNNTTTSQVFVRFLVNNTSTTSGQINANGTNAAAFGSYSDSRLKENIVDLPSQLNNILALRPTEFDYIESEGGGHQIGFIAQEMQQVYPDAVGERSDGMLTVTGWSKTEARLVKAIQEQQTLINQLTTRLNALEGK